MAMSLEDLLTEEGFKRSSKAKFGPRISVASEGRGIGRHDSRSSLSAKRTERTRSHIPRYDSKDEFSSTSSFAHGTSTSRVMRGRGNSWNAKRFDVGLSEDLQGSEITEVAESDEIVEVGMHQLYKDTYSNKVYGHAENGSRNSSRNEEAERQRSRVIDKKKNKIGSKDNRSIKQPESFYKMSGGDKRYDESRGVGQAPKVEQAFDPPSLDEVAVKAVESILSEYIKRFIKDEAFRASLRHDSFASLTFVGLKTESKVIKNLEEAVKIAERAAEESASSKELKKASLQLSVITGLKSSSTKAESSSGTQKYNKLSACAHLYLSVIYVLLKKERTAAKHLLQVFCYSPFQARTTLLPGLWDRLFLPHLSHLQSWYNKETRSPAGSPILANVELLEKVYNEGLDSGTYQFAMYYKDWITKGVEAPSAPVIKIPSFSIQPTPSEGVHGHTGSPGSHVSPKPIVSKKLYDEVFKHAQKSEATLNAYGEENSDSPAPVDKQLILYSSSSVTCTNLNFVPTVQSPTDNAPMAVEARRLHPESSSGAVNLNENDDDSCGKPSLQSIPRDFLCPLTDLLFEDPVTLETGQTFEREAIVDWFDKGYLTCPVTRKPLQCRTVPPTNLILKHVIDKWHTDHFEHLLAVLSQMASDRYENVQVDGNVIISILEQLLTVFSKDKKIFHARRIVSFGGLWFLLRRFHHGSTQEKTLILPLLSYCIEADAGCRNDIARSISRSNLLELLHSKQSTLRTNAVLLLFELICANRRVQAKCFLEGLQDEEAVMAMDDLVIYLQMCLPEQTPLVAVLLLHLSIMSGTQTIHIYQHDAVDALSKAMERSLTDKKLWSKCIRALLILGGCFTSSGKLMTEDWILKLAGFLNGPEGDTADSKADDTTSLKVDPLIKCSEEENAREKWLVSLLASLLGDGKKSFLDSVSKCLSFGNPDMVRACLTTVAWLSSSLGSLPDTGTQLCAFSALISPLKQCLENGELVEYKILASVSLFNFSKIPECRMLLMKFAETIRSSLEDLADVTWTARELNAVISGNFE